MFNIMIMSNDCESNKKYINNFKMMNYRIHMLSKQSEFESVDLVKNQIDVFIIEESGIDDFFNTCELIMKIRRSSNKFIWVMSENEIEKQKNLYFDLGVDGVAASEIEQDIAVLQINNILKHLNSYEIMKKENPEITNQAVTLLPENQSIIVKSGDEIPLTRLEFQVVSVLNENSGTALTHEEIYQIVWNKSPETEKAVKYRVSNIIFHLRQKLKDDSRYIKTVRSKGYMVST